MANLLTSISSLSPHRSLLDNSIILRVSKIIFKVLKLTIKDSRMVRANKDTHILKISLEIMLIIIKSS